MKRTKRIFALLTAIAALLALLPTASLSASAEALSGSCGGSLTWRFDEADGTLILRGSGEMYDYGVSDTPAPWAAFRGEILHVELPDGLTGIGEAAFSKCSAITTVQIPGAVKHIGSAAFSDCSALQRAQLPYGVRTIGDSAFRRCAALTEMTIPNSVTEIGESAFYGCSALNCAALSAGLTQIAPFTFFGCASLTGLTLPDGVSAIRQSAFEGCASLSHLTLNNGLTTIGSSAFLCCTAIGELTLPDSLRTIDADAFYNCPGLTEVRLSENVTSIGMHALGFYTDEAVLRPVQTKGFMIFGFSGSAAEQYAQENSIRFVALGKPDLKGSCGDGLTYFLNTETGVLSVKGSGDLTKAPWIGYEAEIRIIDLNEGVLSVADNVFDEGDRTFQHYYQNVSEIRLPASLVRIGVKGLPKSAGAKLTLSENNPAFILDKSGALYSKDRKTLVYFPSKDPAETDGTIRIPEGVTEIAPYAFRSVLHAWEVWLPDSLRIVGEGAFAECINLDALHLGNFVAQIGNLAFSGTRMSSVKIPETVSKIEQNAFGYRLSGGTEPKDFLIIGKAGSEAEAYANRNGFSFRAFDCTFSDVPFISYYSDAVAWASGEGVTTGTGNGKFSPNQPCTRAQVVTLLWRAAGKPQPSDEHNPFTDLDRSKYYYSAVIWAVEQGITTGKRADQFDPNGVCTRAQVITFLWRFAGKPAFVYFTPVFHDVSPDAYYFFASNWARSEGVTDGTGKHQFSPNNPCTRAQVVTFLYRFKKQEESQ